MFAVAELHEQLDARLQEQLAARERELLAAERQRQATADASLEERQAAQHSVEAEMASLTNTLIGPPCSLRESDHRAGPGSAALVMFKEACRAVSTELSGDWLTLASTLQAAEGEAQAKAARELRAYAASITGQVENCVARMGDYQKVFQNDEFVLEMMKFFL